MSRHASPKLRTKARAFPGLKRQLGFRHMHPCIGTDGHVCKRRIACTGILDHWLRCLRCKAEQERLAAVNKATLATTGGTA